MRHGQANPRPYVARGQRGGPSRKPPEESRREHAAGPAEAVIRSRVIGEFAVSQGAVLLAQLVPEAWKMPLDVMCVPMAAITTITSS